MVAGDGCARGNRPGPAMGRRAEAAAAALLLLVVIMTALPAAAQEWLPPNPDVLHQSSLRGPFTAQPSEGNPWSVSLTASYFNVWHYTWHIGSIHRHLGLLGQPLTTDELDFLEHWYRTEPIHQVDLEGWRTDLVVARTLPGRLTATLTIPWMELGGVHWDAIPEKFHQFVGAKRMRRDFFPRGETVLYVRAPGGRIAQFAEVERRGIADISLALAGPLGRWLEGDHRWVVAAEAPTGKRGTLFGSGGWDAAVRWEGAWQLSRRGARLGVSAGYNRLDGEGSWLGIARRNTRHAAADVSLPVGARTQFLATVRWDESPVVDMGELSRAYGALSLGLRRQLAGGQWVVFAVGEDWRGVNPDFTLHLAVGSDLGGR